MAQNTTGDFLAESRHVSVWVRAAAQLVYEFTADTANLTRWVAGLTLDDVDVEFVAANDFGVLDHVVRMDGRRFYNPMRVLPTGGDDEYSEVVFTVRRRVGMSDAEFEADIAAVRADLETLKGIVER